MSQDARSAESRIGVREVAAHAGVSSQTVSRVLNAHPHVRAETRERVLQSIADLGYVVNNAARALGTATTRTIGVIASDSGLFGPAVGIAALEAAARAAGRWISTAHIDASRPDEVDDAARHLLAQGVDGIVVVAPHTATLPRIREIARGLPVVTLHAATGEGAQQDAAALAVAHLADLGHRRIAHLAGPAQWQEAMLRGQGVEAALAEHHAAGPRWEGDWSAAAGARLAPEIAAAVRAPGGPTAIVVANDQMALGLVAGLRAAGIRVPDDVSVTGFDDNPDAAYYRPALTTVRVDVAGEARACIAALIGDAEAAAMAPATLVARASTAAPPAPSSAP
ncbi:LacI family DNA-binding transcriptional regulator [Microbacterium telephonicum]|uniref:DNA-binding LacI/PurR family transcriptional regulator n=1 Tax=Microbacterium telephonicum TaxID=1714841 RepID=A0A498CC16_9MICO|nr:LacI family DNA-binding transcriptional regulator [Microbacterium telephonicum]RLK52717.1 DNA-binding LacI/PurR family transcriptional regulator [Microbacterium telephonicum]